MQSIINHALRYHEERKLELLFGLVQLETEADAYRTWLAQAAQAENKKNALQ